MELDKLIRYCKIIAENKKAGAEIYKCTEFENEWKEESEVYHQIADNLKLLKDIRRTGCCNTCKSRRMCEYEPEAGQMTRYNCPFYKEERIIKKVMTYGDIYDEFCKKFQNAGVDDYRPAYPQYLPSLVQPIPYAIVVWLKDGSKMVYIAEEAKDE